jgi:Flp pilus assembly protein TadD
MRYGLCGLLAVIAPLAACDPGSGARHHAARVPEPPLMDEQAGMSEDGALEFARSLQKARAHGEAYSVLIAAHARYPDSQKILSAYGRQAALMGQDAQAMRLLRRAIRADREDWRALSAYAVIAERQGHDDEARQAFAKARAISGANTPSLNNLGMFYLLEGRASDAAAIFRQALISPQIDKSHILLVKRNLAVALAMQGEFEKADDLAGYALPRELADADRREIEAFMGVDAPAASEDSSWRPRLADASPVISNSAR